MIAPITTTPLSRVQLDVLTRIIEYVEREDFPAGHHLTEKDLARELAVSRSPIRVALSELERKRVVHTEANKGHYLACAARDLAGLRLSLPKPGDESLYDRIARERIRDTLPEQFTEAAFMRRFGVTRAQLVRTLARMSQDGLVQRAPGNGWMFLPALNTAQDYAASYRFRMLVEPGGLLEPTFSADLDRLMRGREAHHRMIAAARRGDLREREVFEVNAAFHEMLASFSGNRFIIQTVEHMNRLRRLSEYYGYDSLERIKVLLGEHLQIMDAVEAGDLPWASDLLRRHLQVGSRASAVFGPTAAPDDD
jgi:DNA-binding GntR family transcriptional regulator